MLRGARGEAPAGDYRIPLGVAKARREGTDITAVTYGWQVQECLAAAEELQKEGINLEVIDLRTLVPLDYHRVLESVKKTRLALVVHAATEFCGFGGELRQPSSRTLRANRHASHACPEGCRLATGPSRILPRL